MAIKYTHKEELWNAWSHAGGIVMGVAFGIVFLVMAFKGDNPWARLGVCLYLFGMLGSYVASTIYHTLPRRSKWKERLRKWDHAAIYWHIAGSYSPLTPGGSAYTRLLGMESLYLRMDLRNSRYHREFHQTERAL